MDEQWKAVKGYEGKYEVSNKGNVKSYLQNKEKYIKGRTDKDGYRIVTLRANGKGKDYKLHRIVAEAFIENPLNLPQVNHKDENKTNNSANNLEWCDCKYNANYGNHNYLVAKSKFKPVIQYDLKGNKIAEYESILNAELKTGISHQNISKCCLKRKHFKTAGGFVWKYAKERE